MSKLKDDARWLVQQITANNAAIKALSKPQLGTSSIEAGAIEEYDTEGTLVLVTGQQFDGTHASVTVAGPVPPEPVAPSVLVGAGQVEVRWSGKFVDDAFSPMDFSHVSVHVSELEIFEPDNDTQRATITGESGDTATILLEPGEWSVLLVAVSAAGTWSDPSDTITVEVADTLTPDAILDTFIGIDEKFVETAQAIADVQLSADGKTSIHNSVDDAGTGDYADGDRWQKWTTLDPGGKLLASWRYTAGAWVAESMDPTYLPLIDIGAGTFGELSGGRLIAGSVEADLLEATLILATDIVAGDPAGTHAKMGSNGFSARASVDGQDPVDVVRMGTSSSDIVSVIDPATGNIIAGMDSSGGIAGQTGNFATDVSIGGNSVLAMLDDLPKGLIAWASRGSSSKYWASSSQPYLHLSFDVIAGRAYRISTTPINMVGGGTGSQGQVNLHYTATTSALTSDTIISYALAIGDAADTSKPAVTINRLITPGATGPNAILLSYKAPTGLAKIAASAIGPVIVTVEDMGLAVAETGELRDGSGDSSTVDPAPPVVVKNYDKTWTASGMRSFIGSGAHYNYNSGYMYSGLSPAGYGDLSSMAIFPSLTGELSGATITAMWVYVYYDFWYQGAGGNAYIGFHGQTGLTTTKPAKTYSHAVSNGWPRAAGRWIPISSSTFAGWKAGTHRGITLGGSGGGYERYGYAHDIRIRAKYTK